MRGAGQFQNMDIVYALRVVFHSDSMSFGFHKQAQREEFNSMNVFYVIFFTIC
jgi:hypothetical protein